MNLTERYEKLAAYSLLPGLALLSGLNSYFAYDGAINPAVFSGNLILDSFIQVFLALVFALLVSTFWVFPLLKYLEYRKEVRSK